MESVLEQLSLAVVTGIGAFTSINIAGALLEVKSA